MAQLTSGSRLQTIFPYLGGSGRLSLHNGQKLLLCLILLFTIPIGGLPFQTATAQDATIKPPSRATQIRIYELLKLGRIALSKKEFENALTYFNAILELDPTFAEAHFRIGTTYVQQKKYPQAIKAIKTALNISPGNIPVLFSLASIHKMANQMDEAIAIYQEIIDTASNPRHVAQARQRLEQVHNILEQRRLAEEAALAKLEQEAQAQPDNIPLLLKLAERYIRHEKLAEAEATYRRVVEIEENNPIAHLRLAELHYKAGRVDETFAELEILLHHFPSGVAGRATIDLVLKLANSPKIRNSERAGKLLQLATEAAPNNTPIHTSLGIYYQIAKEFEKAEEHFIRATELDPDNALTHANLASVYIDMKKPDLAIKKLEKVISLEDRGGISPRNRKALVALYIKLGTALIKGAEMAQGQKAFEYALMDNPDDPKLLTEIAEAYFSINALPYAIKHFEKAKSIAPDNPKINYYLGIIYDESGELDKAIEAYSKLVGTDSPLTMLNAEDMANKLALIIAKKAFNEGKLKQAEEILVNSVVQMPDDFIAHFYLALIYENTGRRELAVKEYEEAVRIKPNHSAARLQLGQLYEQMWLEEDAQAQYSMVTQLGNNQFMEKADRALLALSKKINGMSYSLTQSLSFDTNSNLDQYNPRFGYRSAISFNATYRYKISPNMRFRLLLGPSYQGHITRSSDIFNLSLNPTLTLGNGSEGVELSYRYANASGFLNEETAISETHNYSAQLRTQIEPLWHSASPDSDNSIPDPWSLSGSVSYRQYISVTNPLFSSNTYKAQLNLSLRTDSGYGINLGYDYSRNLNVHEVGNDNAYSRHGISGSISFAIVPGWMSSLSYSLSYTAYSNPDSVSKDGQYRRSLTNMLSISLSHYISRQVRVFGGYSWTYNRANLPINIDLSDVERISQSSSLADYSSQSLTLGLGLSF